MHPITEDAQSAVSQAHLTTIDAKELWRKQQADQCLKRYRNRITALEASLNVEDYGPHGARRVRFSVASHVQSWNYFTLETSWAVFCALAGETREKTSLNGGNRGKKDSDAMTLAALFGGTSAEGARAIAQNVEGFDILGLDFDLGHFTKDEIEAKCRELGLECVVTESYSSGTMRTNLVWATFDEQGAPTMSEFAEYTQREFNVVDHDKVIAEQCESYLVDVEGYDAERLGKVTIAGVFNSAVDPDNDPVELSFAIDHAPIPKTRVFILLNERVKIARGERVEKFKERYKRDVYNPVAEKFGHSDPACSSIERRWYWRTHRPFYQPAPAVHVSGKPLEASTLAPAPTKSAEPQRKAVARGEIGGEMRADWRGFLAADAAAELLAVTADNRNVAEMPLVAVDCPFRSSHGSSKTGRGQLMIFNAAQPGMVPVVKCHSGTCQKHEHTWEGYLTALFDDLDVSAPKYWLAAPTYELPVTSNFIVPKGLLPDALVAMNQRWAVVRIGGKTRFMVFRHDATPEFLDKSNLLNEFGAAYYEQKVVNDEGEEEIKLRSFLPVWLDWSARTQYRGYGFFPAPAGHPLAAPEGVFNAYRGPTVEPKRGSWKRLLGHLYRNVCRRDAERFRWLIGYVAQMIQEPHVKPGTHLVLCGNEGTGKSKLGEWLIRLLRPCAMSITSRERLTGRFNAHYERLLFGLAEEVFWAGDKEAEGAIKALATAEELDYERKGIDPEPGRNYTRLMICSNEDWVVPAGSGGRRWFVLRVGNEHEQDHSYFAAIDNEMENGGLEAMLYDLQRTPLAKAVNVRKAPVTPWLVEQRLHSQDARKLWWRSVLAEGGFGIELPGDREFIQLDKTGYVSVRRDDIFASAQRFFEKRGRPATREAVRSFVAKELEGHPSLFYDGHRETKGKRKRTYVFAGYDALRDVWFEKYGERIEDADESVVPVHKEAESDAGDDGWRPTSARAGAGSDSLH